VEKIQELFDAYYGPAKRRILPTHFLVIIINILSELELCIRLSWLDKSLCLIPLKNDLQSVCFFATSLFVL